MDPDIPTIFGPSIEHHKSMPEIVFGLDQASIKAIILDFDFQTLKVVELEYVQILHVKGNKHT